MSGRAAIAPLPRQSRLALAAGVFAACAAVAGVSAGRVAAEPPLVVDVADDTPPLPPAEPARPPAAAKYRVPEPTRPIFAGSKDPKTGVVAGGIEDDKPLASEKQSADEYTAWLVVVQHAAQFAAADLEAHAARDLTVDDLTYPARKYYRLDLVGFRGKLTNARRVRPTAALADAGVKELFEGWLAPVDESPAKPVCVAFTAWPAGVPAPPDLPAGKPAGEPLAADHWASFAGYSFKLMSYPGPDAEPGRPAAGGWRKAPLLVGKSFTPLAGPPPEATAVAVDKSLRVYKLIMDDAPIARVSSNWEEASAWTRLVLHARKVPADDLAAAARRDLKFADLFVEGRQDYQLDPVHLRGRLIRLRQGKETKPLTDAGVPAWYEGWIVTDGEPRGNPVCVVFTDLPPGLEPKPLMNATVSFAGYSFKLMHYESQEPRRDDPAKNVWKRAPLLIGRTVVVEDGPDEVTANVWSPFLPGVVGGLLVVIGAGVVLSRWYRRGDRQARAEMDAVRRRNPFGGAAD